MKPHWRYDRMTPQQYIAAVINCVVKYANDQGMGDKAHEYAIGIVVTDVMTPFTEDVVFKVKPGGRFSGFVWEAYTRSDLQPYLLEAVALFMDTIKEGETCESS